MSQHLRRWVRRLRQRTLTPGEHHAATEYGLGALTPQEMRRFKTLLADCEICAANAETSQATAARLADTVRYAPPPEIWNAIRAATEIDQNEAMNPPRSDDLRSSARSQRVAQRGGGPT